MRSVSPRLYCRAAWGTVPWGTAGLSPTLPRGGTEVQRVGVTPGPGSGREAGTPGQHLPTTLTPNEVSLAPSDYLLLWNRPPKMERLKQTLSQCLLGERLRGWGRAQQACLAQAPSCVFFVST